MAFLQRLRDGGKLIFQGLKVLVRKPVFLVPIILGWLLLVPYTFWAYQQLQGEWESLGMLMFDIYLILLGFSIVLFLSGAIMLELVEQEETGGDLSFFEAFKEMLTDNLIAIIFLGVVYSVIWFLLIILEALASFGEETSNSSIFDYIEKLIRMSFFLCLPAIAWDHAGIIGSLKRGWNVFKTHTSTFTGMYVSSILVAILVGLPVAMIEWISNTPLESLPFIVQFALAIYGGMIWSLGIYLEQMSTGLLYLWHLKWQEAGGKGELSEIDRPSLLDEVGELNQLKTTD